LKEKRKERRNERKEKGMDNVDGSSTRLVPTDQKLQKETKTKA